MRGSKRNKTFSHSVAARGGVTIFHSWVNVWCTCTGYD